MVTFERLIRRRQSRFCPAPLKREMKKRLAYDEDLETNLRKFIKILTREAINCQNYAKDISDPPKKTSAYPTGPSKGSNGSKNSDTPPTKPGKGNSEKEKPLCLWPPHKEKGFHHYLKDCKGCPKDEKDKLFEAHRASTGKAKRTKACAEETKSVSFTAMFGCIYRMLICADNVSDDNFLDTYMLIAMKRFGVQSKVEDLARPREFQMAASSPNGKPCIITCKKVATVDVELHIRHGSALILRGVRWLVTDRTLGEPLLGRPVLEFLGLNTREILAAAAEKYSGLSKSQKICNPLLKEKFHESLMVSTIPKVVLTMLILMKKTDGWTLDQKILLRKKKSLQRRLTKLDRTACHLKDSNRRQTYSMSLAM